MVLLALIGHNQLTSCNNACWSVEIKMLYKYYIDISRIGTKEVCAPIEERKKKKERNEQARKKLH